MKTYSNSYKIYDSHIHFGQFYNQYTSSTELRDFLDSVGVECFAASSTTICEGDYDKVLREIVTLKELCGNKLSPILWIMPQMLKDGGLFKMMDSGICWRCLKIHPQLHPTAWLGDSHEMKWMASMASVLRLPLLIHTGEKEGCYPKLYEKVIAGFPDVTFILAHGRPINDTIELMKKYPNVWTDTAFMPTENIVRLCTEKLSDRVLWGSDYPIPKYYYPEADIKAYYLDLIKKLKDSVNQDDFEMITQQNFEKLLG